jgi:hypothetical protein
MIHTLHIDDSNPKAKIFLEFIKTLDFINVQSEGFTLTEEHLQIVNQRRENRIAGNTTTHSWEDVKGFAKANYSKTK